MPRSTTSRTTEVLRALDFRYQIVEVYVPQIRKKRDLFGFCDIEVVWPMRIGTTYLQVTGGGNGKKRIKKITTERSEVCSRLLACQNSIEVWDWRRYRPAKGAGYWDAVRWDIGWGFDGFVITELPSVNEMMNLNEA